MPYSLNPNKSSFPYLKQIILFLALSFALAFVVRLTHTPLLGPVDIKLFYFINSGIRNRFFDFILPVFGLNWLTFIFIGVFFIYLIVNKGVKVSLVFVISFILMFPLGVLLKKTANLTRPYAGLSDVYYYNGSHQWQLIKNNIAQTNHSRGSFPSGHCLRFFILAGFLWKRRKIRLFLLIIGALIMLSRVYTGAHYPSDTLAGAFIAAYSGLLAQQISKNIV